MIDREFDESARLHNARAEGFNEGFLAGKEAMRTRALGVLTDQIIRAELPLLGAAGGILESIADGLDSDYAQEDDDGEV